jgi:hypothetical protein
MFEMDWTKPLLERGTGASYVSQESLLNLQIPTALHLNYPKTYKSFSIGQNGNCAAKSRKSVCYAAQKLNEIASR